MAAIDSPSNKVRGLSKAYLTGKVVAGGLELNYGALLDPPRW